MKPTAVALIDGEHYPPVVVEALEEAGERFTFVGALFLGGTEKIKAGELAAAAEEIYGLPVVLEPDWKHGLEQVLARYRPEVVVDLSDEPVLGYEQRFRLISHSLARNVTYVGSDFQFSPPSEPRLCSHPSLSIVGTAKRVGKTAISGFVARTLQGRGPRGSSDPVGVVVVAMGRGGPEHPEVVDGRGAVLTSTDLLEWSHKGRHAASDYFEDAVLSRVVTVGCRRCGGGMAGQPFVSNVAAGAVAADGLDPDLVIFEGSGAAVPPVHTDARLLVAGAHQPLEYVAGYLGTYRLLTSDALVLTMAEEPLATRAKVEAIIEAATEINIDPAMLVPVVFRPQPAEPVEGDRVAFFSTAPPSQHPVLRRHLEEHHGCRVEMVSSHLSDRTALAADMERPEMERVDTVLTEIKAAAIDVVAEKAQERGLRIVFVDNLPEEVAPSYVGALGEVVDEVETLARERHARGD